MRAGFLAWIRLRRRSGRAAILLIDCLSVLGWERWRAMEERHALGLIRAVLQIIADEGELRPEMVGTLAHVLLASVNEVALLVALSDDPRPRCGRVPKPSTSCWAACSGERADRIAA